MARETPWQTTGPFFHFGLAWPGGADLISDSDLGARPDLTAMGHDLLAKHGAADKHLAKGARIELVGNMFDNRGEKFTDALIEIWQADARGEYGGDPYFLGFGRCATDRNGGFRFRTIRPGRVKGPGNLLQAPHIALGLVGPGILKRLVTRIYFADAPENTEDPILVLVPEERRSTLIARAEPQSPNTYRFDIRLGGMGETVFFEF
jgi:protocatechuate 3,4-dioxygenase, alpha subunit